MLCTNVLIILEYNYSNYHLITFILYVNVECVGKEKCVYFRINKNKLYVNPLNSNVVIEVTFDFF